MSAGPSTVADLRRTGVISSLEVAAAIDAYMRDPATGPHRFASGHSLDVAALVNGSPAFAELDRFRSVEAGIRTTLAAAIMAAHPTPP